MPLPSPRKGESEDDFVARFMASSEAKSEFSDREQRLAVAFSTFRRRMRKSAGRIREVAKVVAEAVVKAIHGTDLTKSGCAPRDGTRRRIVDARITRIALCRRGKNGYRTLLKDDGALEIETLVKAGEPGHLLAVVYAPDSPDADGDVASADVIRKAAHQFLRDHREIDVEHDGEVLGPEDAYVAESFIVAKGDARFQDWKRYDGGPAGDLTGAWAVDVALENPLLDAAFRAGEWDGVSMFGRAAVEHVAKSAASEEDMTPEQIKELAKSLAEAVVAALPKPAEPKKEEVAKSEPAKSEAARVEPPRFEGDPASREDLAKFATALRGYELQKSLAEGKLTADQVAAMAAKLGETQPSDEDAGVAKEDSDEVKALKRQLFKALRKSNAPERRGADDQPAEDAQLAANHALGLEIAKAANAHLGLPPSMKIVSK